MGRSESDLRPRITQPFDQLGHQLFAHTLQRLDFLLILALKSSFEAHKDRLNHVIADLPNKPIRVPDAALDSLNHLRKIEPIDLLSTGFHQTLVCSKGGLQKFPTIIFNRFPRNIFRRNLVCQGFFDQDLDYVLAPWEMILDRLSLHEDFDKRADHVPDLILFIIYKLRELSNQNL